MVKDGLGYFLQQRVSRFAFLVRRPANTPESSEGARFGECGCRCNRIAYLSHPLRDSLAHALVVNAGW